MTPSRPAPSKRRNQSAATRAIASSPASGGPAAPRSASSSSSARAPLARTAARAGRRRPTREQVPEARPTPASPSASSLTRDAAGWRRSCSASKSSPPSRAITISPSSTQRGGSAAASGVDQLGEVALERLLVAALDVDLVAVAKDERAKAVPLRLEQPAVAVGQVGDALGEHRRNRRRDGQAHHAACTAVP